MIKDLSERLAPMLPLVIDGAEYEDPSLVLCGDDWSLSTTSSWRVVKGGVLLFGWSDESAPTRLRDLRGKSVVGIEPQCLRMAGDPAFALSTGEWLEIFSDHPEDPWVFRTPGLTYVGSPSDPQYTD